MTDPINALDGLLAGLTQGPLHEFSFDRRGDWAGIDAEALLRQYHIPVWERGASENEVTFKVKAKQAEWAEYILCRAGVPLTCQLLNSKHRALLSQESSTPKAWSRGMGASSIIGHIVDAIGGKGSIRTILGETSRRPERRRRRR